MAMSNRDKQRRFKEKMRARGFRQKTIWVRAADYKRGYDDAQIGATNMSEPPDGVHRLSWTLGWLDFIDKRDRNIKMHVARKSGKLLNN